MKKVRKAVIPAAGHGTRFLPVTKALPKEMLALIDTPALQYVAQEAADSGIEEILVVINREKELIRRYFCKEEATCAAERELDDLLERVRFEFVYQDEADGTAGAVLLAREFTADEPFAVMYGDDVIVNDGGEPCLKQLIRAYGRTGKTVLGVQERPRQEAAKYAVIRKGRTEGRLTEVLGIVEKPSPDDMPSTLSSLGRYVLTPDIYGAIERAPVFRGEKYLTHAIDLLTDKGVYAYDFEGVRYDIGDKFGFLQANVEMGLRRYGARMTDYLRGLVEGK
ncbi:MAG: UTP--glucose-1-phosphate uridylyltransferase [Christensenellales bacterium]|nr:UTP--glucose-1-phosphate uridylyltransferase [Christensenellales bacterium]